MSDCGPKPLRMLTECWACEHAWWDTGREFALCPKCGEANFTGWSQDAEDKVNTSQHAGEIIRGERDG